MIEDRPFHEKVTLQEKAAGNDCTGISFLWERYIVILTVQYLRALLY